MSSPQPDRHEVQIRRAPKYGRFLLVGGLLGLIVTFVLTSLYPADPNVGFGALFAYFCLYGVPTGVALGAVVALLLDRASARRSRTVAAQREAAASTEASSTEVDDS